GKQLELHSLFTRLRVSLQDNADFLTAECRLEDRLSAVVEPLVPGLLEFFLHRRCSGGRQEFVHSSACFRTCFFVITMTTSFPPVPVCPPITDEKTYPAPAA